MMSSDRAKATTGPSDAMRGVRDLRSLTDPEAAGGAGHVGAVLDEGHALARPSHPRRRRFSSLARLGGSPGRIATLEHAGLLAAARPAVLGLVEAVDALAAVVAQARVALAAARRSPACSSLHKNMDDGTV